jgi:hypothetical protein
MPWVMDFVSTGGALTPSRFEAFVQLPGKTHSAVDNRQDKAKFGGGQIACGYTTSYSQLSSPWWAYECARFLWYSVTRCRGTTC